jgi:hypothetical protein
MQNLLKKTWLPSHDFIEERDGEREREREKERERERETERERALVRWVVMFGHVHCRSIIGNISPSLAFFWTTSKA